MLASIEPLADAIEQDEDLATALTARMLECVDRDLLDLLIRNPSFYVSINLPPVALGRERLRPVLQGLGLAHRAPQLVGEITERRALDDLGRAAIREIRRVGAKIALDDFGTGNSGLGVTARPPRPIVAAAARAATIGLVTTRSVLL